MLSLSRATAAAACAVDTSCGEWGEAVSTPDLSPSVPLDARSTASSSAPHQPTGAEFSVGQIVWVFPAHRSAQERFEEVRAQAWPGTIMSPSQGAWSGRWLVRLFASPDGEALQTSWEDLVDFSSAFAELFDSCTSATFRLAVSQAVVRCAKALPPPESSLPPSYAAASSCRPFATKSAPPLPVHPRTLWLCHSEGLDAPPTLLVTPVKESSEYIVRVKLVTTLRPPEETGSVASESRDVRPLSSLGRALVHADARRERGDKRGCSDASLVVAQALAAEGGRAGRSLEDPAALPTFDVPRVWLTEAPHTDAQTDGFAYGEEVMWLSEAQMAPPPPPPRKLQPNEIANLWKYRCARNPACVKGLRHWGVTGPCRIRTEAEAVATALKAARRDEKAKYVQSDGGKEAIIQDVRLAPSTRPSCARLLAPAECVRWYCVNVLSTGEYVWCLADDLREPPRLRSTAIVPYEGGRKRGADEVDQPRGKLPKHARRAEPAEALMVVRTRREAAVTRAFEDARNQSRKRDAETRRRDVDSWREWHAEEEMWWPPVDGLSARGSPSPREIAMQKEQVWRKLVPEGRLCVRSCSWPRVDGFLQRMKREGGGEDSDEFNIDYILRQLQPMRGGPEKDELHVLLQLQLGDINRAPAAPAATEDVLGVVAAIARLSRRVLSVEFRAIYVIPQLRGTSISSTLVHLALSDVEEQTAESGSRRELRASPRGANVSWGASAVEGLKAFVVLPHCMQVSAKFWGRVGFQLGQYVDRKEHKQATLRSKSDLSGPEPHWSFARRVRSHK